MTPGPKPCTHFCWGNPEIPQKCPFICIKLDPPKKLGNLMTPEETIEIVGTFIITKITHDPKSLVHGDLFQIVFSLQLKSITCVAPARKGNYNNLPIPLFVKPMLVSGPDSFQRKFI